MAAALRALDGGRSPAGTRPGFALLRLAPAATLALFLLPVGAGVIGTLLPAFGYLPALGGTGLSLDPWRDLLAAPGLGGALRLSLTSGLLSTALSFLLTIGIIAACHGSPLFGHLRRWLTPLLAVPHLALAVGFAFLFAPSGWVLRLISPWASGLALPPDVALIQDRYGLALTLALTVKETPYLLLMTLAALEQVNADQRLAVARSLGYGPFAAWIKIVLPAVYPRIRLPLYAVLAYAISVVDMALVLAPTTPPPLAVMVLRWLNDPDIGLRFQAAAGATAQGGLLLAALGLLAGLERLAGLLGRLWLRRGGRGGAARLPRAAFRGALFALWAVAGSAMAALALWSLARRWRFPEALPSSWTLENWLDRAGSLPWASGTTLACGLAATAIALVLALGCLENEQRHGLSATTRSLWLLYAPLLVPQVSFLFGVQVLAVEVGLDGTWWALVWSHLLFVLPYVFLSLAEPYRAFDRRIVRTALCLGATPARVFWRVKLPMLRASIVIAAAVGFAVSVAQYLPTLFAGSGRFATLATEAAALATGADRRVVAVYAFLQAALPLVAFAAALTFARRRHGERHSR
jgi:putative thiamine transport system permease protein